MTEYQPVFGHVNDIPTGAHFASRRLVMEAKLHKTNQAGISWGRDSEGQEAADAIVLNKGYEDDRDNWDKILYTGAGGRDQQTRQQVEDQTWERVDNSALRRSHMKGYPIRVIRGYRGEEAYSPVAGYRYDGLYTIVDTRMEKGERDFQVCRFELRRVPEREQELTPLEQQVEDAIVGALRRRTSTIERIVRDTAVVRRVKRLHEYTCQICRLALMVGADGARYAEGAHIQPLGGEASGPDIEGNVLCLCANCHVRLDRGAVYLTDDLRVIDRYAGASIAASVSLRTVTEHRIGVRFIQAHRRLWGIHV